MPRLAAVSVTAYILIQTEVGKAAQVATEVSSIDGVVSADDVTGPHDARVHVWWRRAGYRIGWVTRRAAHSRLPLRLTFGSQSLAMSQGPILLSVRSLSSITPRPP